MTRDTQSWWVVPSPRPAARVRLFCFPFAGGSATAFHRFGQALPPEIEVASLQLPGRGFRLREPALTTLERLFDGVTGAIGPRLDRPFALFGHSFGAMMAFEVARWLRRTGRTTPVHLLASAAPAPQDVTALPVSTALAAPQFWTAVHELYGTPAQVLNDPELLGLVVPPLKLDFELYAAYRYAPEPPLDVPITALYGSRDPRVGRTGVEAWRAQTTAAFAVHEVPGPHLYLQDAPPALTATVTTALLG